MARLTPSSTDDPVQQILECLASPDALDSLYRLYAGSPDIRASLRLIPLSYIDALCTASEAASLVGDTRLPHTGRGLAAKFLQLVMEKAQEGNGTAATLLADLLDNDATASSMLSEHQIAQNILSRVRSHEQLFAHTRLLQALGRVSGAGWVPCLLEAVAEGIFVNDGQLTQLLCLFSLLLKQYGDEAVGALESLNVVRKLARHVIKLLSEPSPLVAAPALHVLTRMLLHPRKATEQSSALKPTPLTILADSLGSKLFDDTHMERTLVLTADLCINCCAGAKEAREVDDDLLVLDAVAGVVSAIASAQAHQVRDRLFRSTKLLPAIEHLVAMAERDRRYLCPLLAIVNSIMVYSSCNTEWPLVSELVCSRQQPQLEDTSSSSPSMLDTMVDMVISGIEDMVDTVPHFTLPALQHDVAERSSRNPLWPRVSSDESGCGWFVNCSKQQRQLALEFLQTVLPMQTKQDQYWMRELFSSVSQVLDRFVHPAKLPPSAESSPVSSPSLQTQHDKLYCDPFGTAAIAANVADRDCWKRQAYAQSQVLAIGSYYWTIRPLLLFISKLVATHPAIYSFWQDDVAKQGLANFMHWANDIYQLLPNSSGLSGHTMFQDIRDILESTAMLSGDGQQIHSSGPNDIQQSVATPAESSQSSIAASPRMDDVINMNDLVAANSSQMEPTAQAALMMQAAIVCQWARICEAELAVELLQCHGGLNPHGEFLTVKNAIEQSMLLLTPSSLQEPNAPYVLETVSLAMSAQSHALKPYIEHQSKLQHCINNQQVQLTELNETHLQLQANLHQAQARSAQLQAEAIEMSSKLDLAQAANQELSAKLAAYEEQKQQAEQDAAKWKHDCEQSAMKMEQLEASCEESGKRLAEVSADCKQLQESMTAKQARWDETHKAMSDSISQLETALNDAVARLRQLESEKAAEMAAADELRSQLAVMNAKLSEYNRLSETMFKLSRLPH
ncbi:hypothetical protein EV183_000007 [Coemansia sp. RSA 2336]|nr:hypothetical protein EV183_002516 [Coemansia sp. RSA 2336]KAJ2456451.1 hypothetical protein EV183_000007 [Coemansia sp. RSA 2336]